MQSATISRPAGAAFAAAMAAAVGLALAYRLPELAERPMHTDEAVHAWKFNELWTQGTYHYDPEDYHGPTLYFATLPVMWLSTAVGGPGGGATYADVGEVTFRIVPVLFGVGLILLLPWVADGLGRGPAAVAGMLTAVSPAMSFYSRYYIQETLLAFFAFALIACGWRYVRSRRVGWLLAAGAAAGLMHATKETCIISFGAMGAAGAATWLWERREKRSRDREIERSRDREIERSGEEGAWEQRSGLGADGDAAALTRASKRRANKPGGMAVAGAAAIAAFTSAALYSNLFRSWEGPVNSILTYFNYFDRAGNFGLHDHPPLYYLKMLAWTRNRPGPVWSEGFILALASVGIVAAFGRRGSGSEARADPWCGWSRGLVRFLAVYAVVLTAVYSAIPYKTPWCMLQFLHPLILLAGIGAVALLRGANWLGERLFTRRLPLGMRHLLAAAVGAMLVAGGMHLAQLARLTNFRFAADYRNPYVYAHPTRDVVRLGKWVERLAAVHPEGEAMLVQVAASDAWPLPWYLRRLSRVGYWDELPPRLVAPVVIVDETLESDLAARLTGYRVYHYGLRPDVTLYAHVTEGLWDAFVASERAGVRESRP